MYVCTVKIINVLVFHIAPFGDGALLKCVLFSSLQILMSVLKTQPTVNMNVQTSLAPSSVAVVVDIV